MRVYAKPTPLLLEALDAAPRAQLVDSDAPSTERLTAWAEYGYRRWLEEHERAEKIAAYRTVIADTARQAEVRERFEAAVKAGRF